MVAPGKRRAQCGECRAITRGSRKGERKSPKAARTPEARLRERLKVHGITEEQYDAMLAAQQNLCAICGGPPRQKPQLVVDHCHTTGRVRVLLCNPCNMRLGRYEAMRGIAGAYLARYGAGNPLLNYGSAQ